ncbi:MAG: lipoate--protein ligase family protein [bacterium]|nr:lipoate--protein ligase family protein [bacterium]
MNQNPRTPWRLLRDGDLTGRRNMARDVALLEMVAHETSAPVLRLYGWSPPCLSLGKHQDIAAADFKFCHAHNIDVVRRPTGGRAVLHHLELTYSLIAPLGYGAIPKSVRKAYVALCEGLLQACGNLGIEARMTADDANLSLPGPKTNVPCFKAPAGGEIMVSGRKLIGSAMRARAGTILQHGSILLDWNGTLQAGSMGLESDATLRPFVTTFKEQLGFIPARSDIENTFVSAFADRLETSFEGSAMTAHELASESELAETFTVQSV